MNARRFSRPTVRKLTLAALLSASLLLGAAAAQGADASQADAQAVFGDGVWLIETVVTPTGTVGYPQDGSAYLQLVPGATLAGTAGCNRLSAGFSLPGAGLLAFGPVIATRMACPEPASSREAALLAALESVTEHRRDGETLVLTGGGYSVRLTPGAAGIVGQEGDAIRLGRSSALYLDAFNAAVRAAAEAGAPWPLDPIRVALAYVELLGAPNALITRADVVGAGEEWASQTVITIVEDGLLDDSVAGFQQVVTLRREDGIWSVYAYEGTWLCRRPPGSSVAMPGVCN